jgi:hypothetical protein
VALVNLGRGHHDAMAKSSGTPWLLYTVIGVSALVIVAAVPLLVRARRAAAEPAKRRPVARAASTSGRAPAAAFTRTEPKVRPWRPDPTLVRAVDMLWLRCTAAIICAMGGALLGIAIGTYLMATWHSVPAWISYGFAGAITVGMPAIPIVMLRQLRGALKPPR